MSIDHCWEILKLTFRALALRHSESDSLWGRADTWNVRFNESEQEIFCVSKKDLILRNKVF